MTDALMNDGRSKRYRTNDRNVSEKKNSPEASHYVKYPPLEQLCDNLCDPLTRKFGDPDQTAQLRPGLLTTST